MHHKYMKSDFPPFGARSCTYFVFLILILLLSTQNAFSAEVTLAWDAVEACDDLAGYRVYKTDQEGQYTFGAQSPQMVWQGTCTSCKVSVDEDGCWFVVTAFDLSGNESAPSNEVPYEPLGSNLPPFSPVITSPYYGQMQCDLLTQITTEPFSHPDSDVHGQSRWQISRQEDFSSLILDVTSAEHLTRLPVPHTVLEPGSTYYVRVRFYDVYLEPSDWSHAIELTTTSTVIDIDDNGIPDDQEVAYDVDLNGDGISDSEQPEVIKCVQSDFGNATIGVCKASDSITAIEAVQTIDPSTISDNTNKPKMFFLQLFSYRLRLTEPGATATVRIYFSKDISKAGTFYKYDTISGWQDYSQHATFSQDGRSVILEVKDGGYGDSDGVANGFIVDPGGLAEASRSDVGTSEGTGSDSNGGGSSNGSGCFIATAAFGSYAEPHVKLLREFRDQCLLTNSPGRWFVRTYYRYGPFWADLINIHTWCKPIVRLALMPAVGLSYITVKTSLGLKLIAAGLLFVAFVLACFTRIRVSRS
jgi:hypothetical protein